MLAKRIAGGKMRNSILFALPVLVTMLAFSPCLLYAQECVTCYKSNGDHVPVNGPSWDESRNGVSYSCVCTKSGPRCTPQGSSQSGGSSSSSGNSQTDMMKSLLEPQLQNFFNNLFSPSDNSSDNSSSSDNSTTYTYTPPPPTEEELREAKEKQERWQAQIQKVKDECVKQINDTFTDQQKSTANDFKNRYAKSEAIKKLKQAGCEAYSSLEAAKSIMSGSSSLKDVDGQMEGLRANADFTQKKDSDCPGIKYEVPEVTAFNPVSFQEMVYESVKYKADSISVNVALLKEREKNVKKNVEEKKQAVEEIKQQPKNDSKQIQDAMAALNDAMEEEKQVNEEINKSQKSIEALDKLRSTYDLEKPRK